MTAVVRIPTRGPFSLAELGTFGFGHLHQNGWDGVWRLAFVVDGYDEHAGVEVRQVADQTLELTVHAPKGRVEDAVRQAARIASVDHDGDAFVALGERDPALGRLLAAAPGLRPPLFASPYEGALWALLTQRRSRRQGTGLRQRLSQAHGRAFDLAGQRVWAVPTPRQLLDVAALPGLPVEQLPRVHAVARAALAGQLDVARLAAMGHEEAMADLRSIPGIGPFSSALVVIRATGLSDVLVLDEPRSRAAVQALYGEPDPFTDDRYRALAEGWRPFRTWVAVVARAAAGRLEPAGRHPMT